MSNYRLGIASLAACSADASAARVLMEVTSAFLFPIQFS